MFVHLEQLQKAGVPLLDALSDIRDTAESTRLRDIMGDVYGEVASGLLRLRCPSTPRPSNPSSSR